MPAAAQKQDLIAICDREFAKLTVLLDGLPTWAALSEDAEGWSIKDVIAHRTHWVHLSLHWVHQSRQGLTPEMPAPGYKWSDLKRYNALVKASKARLSWHDVRTGLRSAHLALMREIDRLDDPALYGAPMAGGNGTWTIGRYLEASGASDYRSAAKFVRVQMRRQAAEDRRTAA